MTAIVPGLRRPELQVRLESSNQTKLFTCDSKITSHYAEKYHVISVNTSVILVLLS